MRPETELFTYVECEPVLGIASSMPYAPIKLGIGGKFVVVSALIDSGAALNVLPHSVGLELGAIWNQLAIPVRLSGNLGGLDARALIVTATIGHFAPVRHAYAWTLDDQVPTILGQVNFFMEFNVCFFRSRSEFEIKPRELVSPAPT